MVRNQNCSIWKGDVFKPCLYLPKGCVCFKLYICLFVPEGYWFAVEGLMNTEHLMQQAWLNSECLIDTMEIWYDLDMWSDDNFCMWMTSGIA